MQIKLNYLIVAVLSIILTSNTFSQTSSEEVVVTNTDSRHTNEYADEVVAEFDGHKITLDEFEKAYTKNVGNFETAKEDSIEEYKNFLNLYVPYKMKLRNAFVRGFHDDADLNKELNDYKEKVGVSYIEEKDIIAKGIKRFYDQRSEEVRVSHLMIKIEASEEAAREQAQSILDSIINGANYEEMVAKYSDDKFSKNKGGDIYWFTPGQIIASFEMAAYSTPVGEIYPEIVKTKFGYHILKVTGRQKRLYKIRASHILIKMDKNGKDDSKNAREKITTIRKKISAGVPFDSLAKEYSEDPGSGAKGGDLGFFGRRQMVQPFDEAVFKLKVGEISPVVMSKFGFHIIKLTDIKEYPPFEEEVENIRDLYKKSRYQYDRDEYVDNLKKEFQYKLNENLIAQLVKSEDQITLAAEYKNDDNFSSRKDEIIISTKSKSISLDSLFSFMFSKMEFTNKKLDAVLLKSGVDQLSTELLLLEKAATLEKSDPEFAKLMEDYKNGIYIFKLQEDEVWNKVKIDSTQLKKLYDENKENYRTEDQVGFSEIFIPKKGDIDIAYDKLRNGEKFNQLAGQFTKRRGMNEKAGNYGLKNVGDSELSLKANTLSSIGDYSEPFKVKGGWAIVKLNKKIPARIKTFEEASPEISSMYQETESKRLEAAYNKKLVDFYEPNYYYDELGNAFKQ